MLLAVALGSSDALLLLLLLLLVVGGGTTSPAPFSAPPAAAAAGVEGRFGFCVSLCCGQDAMGLGRNVAGYEEENEAELLVEARGLEGLPGPEPPAVAAAGCRGWFGRHCCSRCCCFCC